MTMPTTIPALIADLAPSLAAADSVLREQLQAHGYVLPPQPGDLTAIARPAGFAAAKAYPMQGILKYHGLSDWGARIAYLPSISINNAAAYALTAVEFDPSLQSDSFAFNGQETTGRALERVQQTLNAVRALTGITSKARVQSRNVVQTQTVGKGLGTSAAGGAALALASLAAACGETITSQTRLVTTLARLLAGSACRVAAGGLALWLSYPGCPALESYALRLDTADQLQDLALITIPIDSRVGLATEMAHHDAPHSPFFRSWLLSRPAEILECVTACQAGDWRTIGQWAELDSIRLHGVTMSGSREQKLFGWEPENIWLFRMCNDLRAQGVPVYFSTDTGPTTVLLTHRASVATVLAALQQLPLTLETVVSGVGGAAELVDPTIAMAQLNKG